MHIRENETIDGKLNNVLMVAENAAEYVKVAAHSIPAEVKAMLPHEDSEMAAVLNALSERGGEFMAASVALLELSIRRM